MYIRYNTNIILYGLISLKCELYISKFE